MKTWRNILGTFGVYSLEENQEVDMKMRDVMIGLLALSLLATACAPVPPAGEQPKDAVATPANTGQDQTVTSDQPVQSDGIPPSPLDPLPNEEKMVRGNASVQSSSLQIMESYPLQIVLHLEGTLPTPCHHLRATVEGPDKENRIKVDVFTMIDPEVICIQVISPFNVNLNLGSFPDGDYTVWMNDIQVGEFSQ